MAKTLIISIFFFFFSSTLITAHANANKNPSFSQTKLRLHRREKLSHLHFYFHESSTGKNPTAVRVAKATTSDASRTAFGIVSVMDDPLTVLPDRSSKRVGSSQGVYVAASQTEFSLLMVLNFVFTQGKYNGSSLSVLGQNSVAMAVREMPIVGGSGAFRFARGYALAKVYFFNTTSLDLVLELDVYVLHY